MDEHERMLAEGPRVAPEPALAEPGFEPVAPEPDGEVDSDFGFEEHAPVVVSPTPRTRMSQRPAQFRLLRLVPLVGVGLFFVASATGYRHYAFVFLAAGFLLSIVMRRSARRH